MVTMFSRGDVVNVTIKGVRYVRHEPDGALTVQTNDPDEHLWALPPQAAIERVAPKEYPVQAGDIWTNPLGYEWVGKADGDLVGVDTGDRRTFDQVNKSSGPLTLVRRRGWSPEQPAEQDKTEQAEPDPRAEMVAGLRAFADLIEARPDLHVCSSLDTLWPVPFEQVATWAQILDVEVKVSQAKDGDHHYVDGQLRGFGLRPYCIVRHPAAPVTPDSEATS